MSGKTVISVLIMLTISPILAIITLVFSNPENFGEHFDVQSLLMMYMFAMITIPLWLTYLPSVILTPIIMNRLSKKLAFQRISIAYLITLAAAAGAIIGLAVLSPFLIASRSEPSFLFSWILSGLVSGSITLIIVVLIYRIWGKPSIGDVA